METTHKLLDENVVAQFSSQQINTYFSLYLKNATSLIENLQKDYENSDLESIRQRAHKLKGSSMVVGALAMKNLSYEIEMAARDGQPIEQEKIQQLKDHFSQLTDLLKQRYNLSFQRGA
jgi:HPt (histidine-containing phosphotransfer) domain-containing protein